MTRAFRTYVFSGSVSAFCLLAGACGPMNVDFSQIRRPDRPAAMDAYDVFAGSWDWTAEMTSADSKHKTWAGTAEWKWTLDRRCLAGQLSAKSGDLAFDASGLWTWQPAQGRYVWWMANNWGYPQEGTATYDAARKEWVMSFTSTGFDGTLSYGQYRLTVDNRDTLKWCWTEWADALHLVKKVEMTGAYKRRA